MTEVLKAHDVAVSFGGIQAVRGVTLSLEKGSLIGLIGPNGAGKTTFLRILTGIVRPNRGSIHLGGVDVTRSPVDKRARSGLAITHQIVRPFRHLSVLENVAIAAGHKLTISPLIAILNCDRRKQEAKSLSLLKLVGLEAVASLPAGNLPLGQLKRLEVARALALDPTILLLDEPLAGLNQSEATALSDIIASLNRDGLTIMLVEHRLAEVMRICQRLAVLDQGTLLAEGSPQEVMTRSDVRAAYMGGP
ncbi:ABC transporter ATP-binding protein [Rhizobium rhizogenes]|uniref:ABC transporter ATP-binding protein n=1 Tax=Rhizobium rhizogenes TaxID=359 RepID=UPI00157190CB|nr:ABC transporter ATP-binding protein [Rhizobium rhizogenes]NTH22889.1 ABC transporter ATP-binding protein [Rhizobium rhizogenes]NTH35918.1 ABC transporter ATP-binding protein [Rhizobium rhizogenes]